MTLRKNYFFLALAMLFLCAFSAQAQTYTVSVSGTVTEQGTGNPIPNHPVHIQFDSTGSGNTYYNTVMTNASGAYSDAVTVSSFSSGSGEVYTTDCQQFIHQVPFQYSPNLTTVSANFQICTPAQGSCQASFTSTTTALGPIAFTDNSTSSNGPITTWFWDFGDGTSSTVQNPVHSYNSPGNYVACLTIGTSLGCQSTFCDSVSIGGSSSCQALFSYSQFGGSVQFTDQSSSTVPTSNWFWDFGDGNTSTQQNPAHVYNTSGNYIVCLTIYDSLQSCTDTYCDSVSVVGSGTCTSDFSFITNGPTLILTDQSSSSSGPITSWFWDFGDGTTSTQQNPNHTYSFNGVYSVCLTIGTSLGCQSTTCDTAVIQSGGGCQANFTFQTTALGPVAFFDSSSTSTGMVISWVWDFGDGTTSTLQNPVHTYNSPGTFQVCLTITTSSGCVSTICYNVVVGGGSNCQAAFNWTTAGTANTVSFFDNSTSSLPVNYFWDFGDGVTSTLQNPVHVYTQSGVFYACLTIADSAGNCTSTTCDTIVIQGGGNPTCQAGFTWTYNGNAVVFADGSTSSPGQIIGWTWDFGDGTTSNNANPVHTYANPGLYNVCLTIFTSDSCSSTSCNQLQASGGGPMCSADFIWSFNGNSVVFTDQSSSSTAQVVSWTWDLGDGTTSTLQNPTHTYAQSGLYNVCLSIFTSDSCSSTICYNVQANGGSGNTCQASFISYPDSTGQFSTIIVNTSTGNGLSYTWDFGDGTTSNSATPTHTYSAPGTYLVCLSVGNLICFSTYCDSVTVSSPQNSVMVQSAVMSLGQSMQQSRLELDVFPNPARDAAKVRVDLPQGGEATMQLIDLNGRVAVDIPANYMGTGVNVVDIDLQGLSQGLYFLNLKVGEYTAVSKLIVQPNK